MQLTIYDEPRALVERDFAAHAASGRAQVEAMRRGTATYKGVPIKFGYLPKYFTEEGYRRLKADLEHTWRILVQVIEKYLEDPAYRALFGFSPELEEMILRRPAYRTLLPVCRLDLFLNEETGDFTFCEFNADGSSAMNENAELYRTYRDTLLYREMDVRYRQEEFELFDSWVRTFLRIYREAAGGGTVPAAGAPAAACQDGSLEAGCRDGSLAPGLRDGSLASDLPGGLPLPGTTETGPECAGRGPDAPCPSVAIVDFLEKGSSQAEFEAFREAFARAGCPAYVAEIRRMRYEGGRLLTEDGHPVDAVYRRAVTSDILTHREEVRPFLEAVRDRKVCLIGDFCTQVVHDKVLFCVLHDPYTASFLSDEDTAFIERHVPYTAFLTPETAARSDVRGDREKWILKPRDSYGAHGILPGRLYSQAEWEAALEARAGTDYILQEFAPPHRTENIFFGKQDPKWESFSNMTGVFLYGGQVAGIYSRASVTPIISVEGDEHEMTSIVLHRREDGGGRADRGRADAAGATR